MKNGVMYKTCRYAVEVGCTRCPLAPYCDRQGYLPGEVVVGDGANADVKLISAFAKEAELKVREVPNDDGTRIFVLT